MPDQHRLCSNPRTSCPPTTTGDFVLEGSLLVGGPPCRPFQGLLMANKTYDLDDFVCSECIEDDALKAKIVAEGTRETCALCGHAAKAVSIAELGHMLYPVIERFYMQGE